MLTRRDVLQRAGTATALATTTAWWLVRRAPRGAPGETGGVESCRLVTPDRHDHAGAVLCLRQAGGDQSTRDPVCAAWGWPTPPQIGRGARRGEPPGYHPVGRGVRATLPRTRPPPGGDGRGSRRDRARGAPGGLPPECPVSGEGIWCAAGRQPVGVDHPPGPPRGRQGSSPPRRGRHSSRSAHSCKSRPGSPGMACAWGCTTNP